MALNDFIPFECISIYLDKKRVHPEDPKASFIVFLVNLNTEILKIFSVKKEIVISWDYIKNAAIDIQEKRNHVIIDFLITCEFQTCELYVKQEVLSKLEATLSLMLIRIQAKRYGRTEEEALKSIRVISTVEDSDFGAEEDLLKSASTSSGIIPSSFQTIQTIDVSEQEVDETQNDPESNIIPASQPEFEEDHLKTVVIAETQFELALSRAETQSELACGFEDNFADAEVSTELGSASPQAIPDVVDETDFQETQSDCSDDELDNYINKTLEKIAKSQEEQVETGEVNNEGQLILEDSLESQTPKTSHFIEFVDDLTESTPNKKPRKTTSRNFPKNLDSEFSLKKTPIKQKSIKNLETEIRYLNKNINLLKKSNKTNVKSKVSDNEVVASRKTRKRAQSFCDTSSRNLTSRSPKKLNKRRKTSEVPASQLENVVSDTSENEASRFPKKLTKTNNISALNTPFSQNENVRYLNKDVNYVKKTVDSEVSDDEVALNQRISTKNENKLQKINEKLQSEVPENEVTILPASNRQKTSGKLHLEVTENEVSIFLTPSKKTREVSSSYLQNTNGKLLEVSENVASTFSKHLKKTDEVSSSMNLQKTIEQFNSEVSEKEVTILPKQLAKTRKISDSILQPDFSENEISFFKLKKSTKTNGKVVLEDSENDEAIIQRFFNKNAKTIDSEVSENEPNKNTKSKKQNIKRKLHLLDEISEDEAEIPKKVPKKKEKINKNFESENENEVSEIEVPKRVTTRASSVFKRRKTIENRQAEKENEFSENEAPKRVTKRASSVSKRRKTYENQELEKENEFSENEAPKRVTKRASSVSKRRKTYENPESEKENEFSENEFPKRVTTRASSVSKRRKTTENHQLEKENEISDIETPKRVTKRASSVSKRRKTYENPESEKENEFSENEFPKRVTTRASSVSKRRKTTENHQLEKENETSENEAPKKVTKTGSFIPKRRKTTENADYGQDFWDEVDNLREKTPKKVAKKPKKTNRLESDLSENDSTIISDFLKKLNQTTKMVGRQVLTDSESTSKTTRNTRKTSKRSPDSESDEWTPFGIKKHKKTRHSARIENEKTEKNSFFSLYNRDTTLTKTRTRVVTRSNRFCDATNYFEESDNDDENVKSLVTQNKPKESVIMRKRSQSVSSVSSGSKTPKTRLSNKPKEPVIMRKRSQSVSSMPSGSKTPPIRRLSHTPEMVKNLLPFSLVPNEKEFEKSFRENLSQNLPQIELDKVAGVQNEPPDVARETSNLSQTSHDEEIPPTFKPFPIFTSESSNYYNSSPEVAKKPAKKIPLKRKNSTKLPAAAKDLPPVILSDLPSPESLQPGEINELNVQPYLFQKIPGSEETDEDVARRQVKVQQLLDKVNQSLTKKMSEKQFYLLAIEVFTMCLKCIHQLKDLKHVLLYSFNQIYCNILQLAVVKSFL